VLLTEVYPHVQTALVPWEPLAHECALLAPRSERTPVAAARVVVVEEKVAGVALEW